MADDIDDLAKRVAAVESRATSLDLGKPDKKELSDIDKRTTALETRFAIAVAVAVALGLGGAGIGGLLVKAYDQIDSLKGQIASLNTQTATLKTGVDELEPKIDALKQSFDNAKTSIINEIAEAGKKKILEIYSSATDIVGRIKIEQHQFCTGEYDGPCQPLPRYDSRDWSPEKVAQTICPNMRHSTPHEYKSQPGGCCGYSWYEVTCFAVQ